MRIRFDNGRIVTTDGVVDEIVLQVADGVVTHLDAGQAGGVDEQVDLGGGWLLPGFIDTQVNGGGGVLFNDAINVDGIRAIGAAHARFGTTAFLPTLISETPDNVAAALDAVDAAIDAGVPGVAGIHVEGPFIDYKRRGIHEPDRLRRLDEGLVDLLCLPRRGRVLLTLAPELCSLSDLRRLTAAGVIVSAGHTDGSYEEVTAAIDAGVRGFTHLFNAMSPLRHRSPGAVGAALDAADTWCGLIVDGVHLHPAAVRIAVRAKGPERIMLVTDAMSCVGTDDDHFMLQGKRIDVRDGVCTYADGTLAGAALDMAAAVRNTVAQTGHDVPTVAQMASTSPAEFLRLADRGRIAAGRRADFAWLDRDLSPIDCWIAGERQVARTAAHAI